MMNNEPEQVFIINPVILPSSTENQKTSGITLLNLENADISVLCRMCAASTEFIIPLFEGDGLANNLVEKIHKHLPIRVLKGDELPQVVCYQCASTLMAWHELAQCCVQADSALRTRLEVIAAQKETAPPPVQEPKPSTSTNIDVKIDQEIPVKVQENKSRILQKIQEMVTTVLNEQFRMADNEEFNSDCNFVCLKCKNTVLDNIESLAKHLHQQHKEVNTKEAVTAFIEDNMIFRQDVLNLSSDGEFSEVDNERDSNKHVKSLKEPEKAQETSLKDIVKTQKSQYYCPFCSSIFTSPTRLIYHLNRHVEVYVDDGFICRLCELTFHEKKTFVTHLQEKHVVDTLHEDVEAKTCRACGFLATDPTDLQAHISDTHNETDNSESPRKMTPVDCPECKKTFRSKHTMAAHLRTHFKTSDTERRVEANFCRNSKSKDQKYISVKCPECAKEFSNKYNMAVHLTKHYSTPEHRCDQCSRSYRDSSSLRQHRLVVHSGRLKWSCQHCGEAFPTTLARDNHARVHTGEKPFVCIYCDKSFRAKDSLKRHYASHLDVRNYECTVCPKKWKPCRVTFRSYRDTLYRYAADLEQAGTRSPDGLGGEGNATTDDDDEPLARVASQKRREDLYDNFYRALLNFRNHHASHATETCSYPEFTDSGESETEGNERNQLTGDAIDKFDDLTPTNMRKDRFDDETRLELEKARIEIDGKVSYTCSVCGRSLSSAHTYVFHRRVHTGERPCVCHVCGKRFTVPGGLRRHLTETHERSRRLSCSLCDKSFANTSNLRQHVRTHTGARPHVCVRCGRGFAQSGSLHAHLKLHEDVFPFRCEECGAQFRIRSGLTRHRLKHTGERPHGCQLCGKTFRHRHELTSHVLAHSAARPYACLACGASFRQKRTLRHHCKKLHENDPGGVPRATVYPGAGQYRPGPHACAYCRARLASAGALKRHLAAAHLHLLFHCDECDQYVDTRELILHMSVHALRYKLADTERAAARRVAAGLPAGPPSDASDAAGPTAPADEFSDRSDTEDGFGALPDSVFDAIEDSPPAPSPATPAHTPPAPPPPPRPPRACPTCGKQYSASSSYFYHVKHAHSSPQTGPHAGPHACPHCARRFKTRGGLRAHSTLHSPLDAPLSCPAPACAKSFKSRASLYVHARRHAPGARRWSCSQCGLVFPWKQELRRHEARHAAARTQRCPRVGCDKSFSVRADLTRHMSTHAPQSAACPHCSTVFAQPRYLKVHLKKKHPDVSS